MSSGTDRLLGSTGSSLEAGHRYEKRLEALHSHAIKLSAVTTIEEIAEVTFSTIELVLGYSEGAFGVVEGNRLNFILVRGVDADWEPTLSLDGPGLTVRTVKTGQTQLVNNTELDSDYLKIINSKTKSELDVPIIVDGEVVALINLEDRNRDAFTDEDRRLLEILSFHVASSIRSLRLLRAEQLFKEKLERLHLNTIKMMRAESVKDLYQTAVHAIEAILDHTKASINVLEDEKPSIANNYSLPNPPFASLDEKLLSLDAEKMQQANFSESISPDPAFFRKQANENHSSLSFPLFLDYKPVAIMTLKKQEAARFTDDDFKVIEIFAQNTSSALSRIKQYNLIQASEDKYRKLVESAKDGVLLISGTKLVFANTRMADLLRYNTPSDLIGRDIGDLVIPEQSELIRERALSRQRGEEPPSSYKVQMLRHDGSTVTMDLSASLTEYEGKPAAFGWYRDVTERSIYESKILSLHQHAVMLQSVESIAQVVSATMVAARSILGLELFDFILREGENLQVMDTYGNRPPGRLLPLNGRGLTVLAANLKQTVLQNDVRDDANFVSGSKPSRAELAVPVLIGGETAAILNAESTRLNAFTELDKSLLEILSMHVASAMTKLKLQEEEARRQSERTKELLDTAARVSGMVRHDLRNPLQTIKNASYFAQQHPEKSPEMLDLITRTVDYSSQILEDLRDTTSPIALNRKIVNLSDLIDLSLKAASFPSSITVEHVNRDAFITASVDVVRLRRVFDNLIKNAVEAMPQGGTLKIQVEWKPSSVQVSVSDTGAGIPQDLRKNLFTPFYSTKSTGTGLGLSYCKQTVEAHGGKIHFTSDVGKGTVFKVTIPVDSL